MPDSTDESNSSRSLSPEVEHNIPKGDRERPQSMFDSAMSFHEVALRASTPIRTSENSIIAPATPSIVCFAIANELYLKSLIMHAAGSAPRTHDLQDLFDKVPQTIRAEIEAEYNTSTREFGRLFASDLPRIRDAFRWRYAFEAENSSLPQGAVAMIARALFVVIHRAKPEWAVSSYQAQRLAEVPPGLVIHIENIGGGVMMRLVLVRKSSVPRWSWGWPWMREAHFL